jgi:putative Ca2+/H+ antiporter (TMEM165/GDT1 family)
VVIGFIPARFVVMEAFLVSTGLVAIAEIGDKTQLLALLLAARYRQPLPIIAGIFIATLLNHGLAGALGAWITQILQPETARWLLTASFFIMAGWVLLPDSLDDNYDATAPRRGVFLTTLLLFFVAEMGDKTQIATIAIAAKYADALAMVAGSTLGMLLANVPVVLLGERIMMVIPAPVIRWFTAASFFLLGIVTLIRSDF